MGMISLLAAIWGGFARLGWTPFEGVASLDAFHGPLMVCGFLGTVIGLERAVALGERWTYAGPLSTGIGAIFLIAGDPTHSGPFIMMFGSAVLVAVFAVIIRRQPAFFTVVMGVGALCWLGGNFLWFSGRPIYRVAPWWTAFLVLTIAGERLELSRLLRPTRMEQAAFIAAIGLFLSGVATTGIHPAAGYRIAGAGMAALALWLAKNDIARRTVRQAGLTRYIAVCLLSGYAWLFAGGVADLVLPDVIAGAGYDATLHAVFLGFVFSMIFGHAPIIFPAVLGVNVTYRPSFYVHLVLLHLTLALRFTGDLGNWWPGRQWGGLLNGVALLVFLGNMVFAVVGPPPPRRPPSRAPSAS